MTSFGVLVPVPMKLEVGTSFAACPGNNNPKKDLDDADNLCPCQV